MKYEPPHLDKDYLDQAIYFDILVLFRIVQSLISIFSSKIAFTAIRD